MTVITFLHFQCLNFCFTTSFCVILQDSVADQSVVSITELGGMDLFSSLREDGSPLIEAGPLMELWDQGGVTNPQEILKVHVLAMYRFHYYSYS